MDCFWCIVAEGEIILKEAEAAKWLKKDESYSVNWLPADIAHQWFIQGNGRTGY